MGGMEHRQLRGCRGKESQLPQAPPPGLSVTQDRPTALAGGQGVEEACFPSLRELAGFVRRPPLDK